MVQGASSPARLQPGAAECRLGLSEEVLRACAAVPGRAAPGGGERGARARGRGWGGPWLAANAWAEEPDGARASGRSGSADRGRALPIEACRQELLALVHSHQVLLLQGETGSGKTTQLPQYLLDAEAGRAARVVVTQPRRLAALSLAARVAQERGERLGEGTVGCKVRGTSLVHPRRCRLLYCTTGVLLQRMKGLGRGNFFSSSTATHLILDEVHERTAELDILLAALREELPWRPALRVVLMSATMDSQALAQYFERKAPVAASTAAGNGGRQEEEERRVDFSGVAYTRRDFRQYYEGSGDWEQRWERAAKSLPPAVFSVPGRSFSVHERFLEDVEQLLHVDLPQGRGQNVAFEAMCQQDYRLLKDLVARIARHGPGDGVTDQGLDAHERVAGGGAVLIFLPGAGEIAEAIGWLRALPEVHCLPLHANLAPEDQQLCFERAPEGLLKVVCATNVAETSVTLPDITVVIDTCRERRVELEPLSGTTCLQEQWCSRASMLQRRGRAGRVRPGVCFHLLRRGQCTHLPPNIRPEIQRLPLESLCLLVRACGLGSPAAFLAETPEPPAGSAIEAAEALLEELGAYGPDDSASLERRLSPLGQLLAELPVHPRIGRLLIFGCLLQCARPAISIAAALSFQTLFLPPGPHRGTEIGAARRELSRGCGGSTDHCVWAEVFERWWQASAQEQQQICQNLGLSQSRMRDALRERKHLIESLVTCRLLPEDYMERWPMPHRTYDRLAFKHGVVRAVVCGGLYPNLVHVRDDNMDLKLMDGNDEVVVHPQSTCAGSVPYDWSLLVYHRKSRTTRLYVYDLTAAIPAALCAFGGPAELMVDDGFTCLVVGRRLWVNCADLPGHFRNHPAHTLEALRGLQRAVQHLTERTWCMEGTATQDSEEIQVLLEALAPGDFRHEARGEEAAWGAPDERRIDPWDGQARTLPEAKLRWAHRYTDEEVVVYWRTTCSAFKAEPTRNPTQHVRMTPPASEGHFASSTAGAGGGAFDATASTSSHALHHQVGSVERLANSVAGLSIESWLSSIALNGALTLYKDRLAERHSTAAQVVTKYSEAGPNGLAFLKPAFFEDAGVSKVGHRRLFEMWFTGSTAPQ